MSLTPEELIKYKAREALYLMAQEKLDTVDDSISINWYRASITDVDTQSTDCVFTLDRTITPISRWDSPVAIDFTYNRIAISDIIPEGTVVEGYPPTTHYSLLSNALGEYGIPLETIEVEEGSVSEEGSVTIQCKGYRWYGSTTIQFQPYQFNLSHLILRNRVVTNFSNEYSSANIRPDIVTHINNVNINRLPIKLTYGDVTFGLPIVDGLFTDATNTKIKVIASSENFTGEEYIYYKRKGFPGSWRKPYPIVYEGESTVNDILDNIRNVAGCSITSSDIVDQTLPIPTKATPQDVVVFFTDTSLAFNGFIKIQLIETTHEARLNDKVVKMVGFYEQSSNVLWNKILTLDVNKTFLDVNITSVSRTVEAADETVSNRVEITCSGQLNSESLDRITRAFFDGIPLTYSQYQQNSDWFVLVFEGNQPLPDGEGEHSVFIMYQ